MMENVSQSRPAGILLTTTSTTTTNQVYYYLLCRFISDSYLQYMFVYAMWCFVNPGISILGLVANMLSLEILRRSGLHKPSSILLFGLVIADSMCLFITMNYGLIVLYYGPNKRYPILCGFQYTDAANYFLAVSVPIFLCIGYWGRYVNTLIPILITLDRLLAVFKPMTFKSLITAKRTLIVVLLSFLLWFPWTLFYCAWNRIEARTVGTVSYVYFGIGKIFQENMELVTMLEQYVIDTLISWIPLTIIILGCGVLSIKIKMALLKRKALTSSGTKITWSRRTTRTLMLTCLIFTVTHVAVSFILYFCPMETQMQVFVRNQLLNLFYALNASSNLLVYITSDGKLLDIFLKIIRRRS
ncbi:G-protein coupled receptor [Biomphalaria glabrata]|nr:G-protein coupled receptor [Biomphalaria glabrata]